MMQSQNVGNVARELQSDEISRWNVENTDETHSVIIVVDGVIFEFPGNAKEKCLALMPREESMMTLIRIADEVRDEIDVPVMILKGKDRSFSFRGLGNDIFGDCYHTGRKHWKLNRVLSNHIQETQTLSKLLD